MSDSSRGQIVLPRAAEAPSVLTTDDAAQATRDMLNRRWSVIGTAWPGPGLSFPLDVGFEPGDVIGTGTPAGIGSGAGVGGLTEQLREFLDAHRVGVLATVTEDGKPRQSVVYYARDGDRLLISTLSKRLKARDVGRTPWASLSVRGDEQPYPSATFSGPAEILTKDIGQQTARIVHRIADTEEPPEPQSDEALAALDRVILAITVERVSAVTHM